MTGRPGRALPRLFLEGLAGAEQVLVTSREGAREVTVPMAFTVGPSGSLYLMTSALSRKVRRWERDPWVRLSASRDTAGVEGTVARVDADELTADDMGPILESFRTAGAATPEALRELLASGTHLLLRVDG